MIAAGLDRDSGQDRVAGFTAALGDALRSRARGHACRSTRYASGLEGMAELLAPRTRTSTVSSPPPTRSPRALSTLSARQVARCPTTSASSASTTAPGRPERNRRFRPCTSRPNCSVAAPPSRCSPRSAARPSRPRAPSTRRTSSGATRRAGSQRRGRRCPCAPHRCPVPLPRRTRRHRHRAACAATSSTVACSRSSITASAPAASRSAA